MIKIRAIIFDVGGVLTSPQGKDTHSYMAKKLNIKRKYWIKKIDPEYNLSIKGLVSQDIAFKKISKRLEIDKNRLKKIWANCYKKIHKKNILVVNLAKKLKKNYRIAILSDQWFLSNKIMKKLNFYKFFNIVILSHKVKVRKPNPRIYKIALKELKLKPQECIFIDNVRKNILPAKKLGINTILFKNINQLKKHLAKLGVKIEV